MKQMAKKKNEKLNAESNEEVILVNRHNELLNN